jgi:Tol biopolymer transport system component
MAKPRSRKKQRASREAIPATLPVSTPDPVPTPAKPERRRAAVIVVAVILGAAGMWAYVTFWRSTPPMPVRTFQLMISGQVPRNKATAISPDGRTIAYVADGRLWLRPVADLTPRMITDTEGVALPFWSPDSDKVGYFNTVTGTLNAISLNDDTPILLSDLPTRGVFGGATWNASGTIIFSQGPSGLYMIDPIRRTTTSLLTPDSDQQDAGFYAPHFLPDGKTCVFSVWRKDSVWTLDALTLPGIRKQILTAPDGELMTGSVYAPSGHLLYNRTQGGKQGVWSVPFSKKELTVTGEPFLLTEKGNWPSISLDQTLVYATTVSKQEQQLVWVDREGNTMGPIGPSQAGLFSPAVSPGDNLIAVAGRDDDQWDLWMYDVLQGSRARLTFDADQESHPGWSGEGDRIIFSTVQGDSTYIIGLAADGTRERETIVKMPLDDPAPTWSRDGFYLVYQMLDEESGVHDLWYIPLQEEDRTPVRFTDTPTDEALPRFSPDGRYLAYQSNESGIWEVYVTRFPEGNRAWSVSYNGGVQPQWSYWSEELFYVRENDLMVVPIQTSARFYTLAIPQRLFTIDGVADNPLLPAYDVASDGQRIVLVREGAYTTETTVTVVENWQQKTVHSTE